MADMPDFDLAVAHKHFAASCFNQAWDLIERTDRSEADDRMMVALSYASIFHWMNRPDCDDQKLATGYWQASRIQALTGNPLEAARLGRICLSSSQGLPPFFLGYAHEALARAHKLMGDRAQAERHLAVAREQLSFVKDKNARDQLEADLEQLADR